MKTAAAEKLIVLALWAFAAVPSFSATNAADAVSATNQTEAELVWLRDLPQALLDARANYRAAVLFFTSPDCPWCFRLKRDVLNDSAVKSALAHYTLVELDADYNMDKAYLYGVMGVPALLVVDNEGMVRRYLGGYRPKAEILRFLTLGLNLSEGAKGGLSASELLSRLAEETLTEEQWPMLMRAMARKESRGAIRSACLEMPATNRSVLVRLLGHSQLPVRLGALEILEEMTGESRGYDPWQDATSSVNQVALGSWQAWLAGTGDTNRVFAALDEREIAGLIADLTGDDEQRSLRARRMLSLGGPGAIDALQAYLKNNPDLSPGIVARLKAVQYALLIPDVMGVDPYELAHRLVMGNLDMRLKALRNLKGAGRAALPILAESVEAPDPLVRETAVDVLVKAAGHDALPLLESLAATEKDPNVLHALIRGLGNIRSKRGLKILTDFLASESEDIAVAAIESLGKLKSSIAKDAVQKALVDPRWRVRVAALQATSALGFKDLAENVTALLSDKDEFVRYTAVQTIVALEARKATDKLTELFMKEDRLKGPIANAFVRMNLKFPQRFREALQKADPETILAVLEGLSDGGERGLDMVLPYVNHANQDVACRALQIAAKYGGKNRDAQLVLAENLERGDPARVRAILSEIAAIPQEDFSAGGFRMVEDGGAGGLAAGLEELFAAFTGGAAKPPPAEAPAAPDAVKVEDLLDAFSGAPQSGVSTGAAPPGGSSGLSAPKRLAEAAKKLMETSADKEIRIQSAVLLMGMGKLDGLQVISNSWSELTDAEHLRVANGIALIATRPQALPLIARMLAGDDEALRERAASMCFHRRGSSAQLMDAVFKELTRWNSPLRPIEVFNAQRGMDRDDSEGRRNLRRWIQQLLKWDYTEPIQCMGLAMLAEQWRRGDAELLDRYYKSENQWLRRAAYYAAGRNLPPDEFHNKLPDILADSSEYVRMVIPAIGERSGSSRWLNYFAADQFSESYGYYDSSGRRLSGALETAVRTLTKDVSPRVRFEAFMTLLNTGGTVDLAALLRTMNEFTDQETVGGRVSEYLLRNYTKLDGEFAVLLPYLQQLRYRDDTLEKVYDHFGPAASVTNMVVLSRRSTLNVTVPDMSAAVQPVDTNAQFHVVVFEKRGCPDCRRVRTMLEREAAAWPGMRIEYRDIAAVASMRLNEHYSEWFEVAPNLRLVAPAVFAAAGALVKTEIAPAALHDLLRRSAGLPDEWFKASAAGDADRAIESRFAALSVGVIGLSGLLDGINPCAFATLIFFLSYLQVARRTASEILRIGMAFVAGVFLAYFVLGAGLLEIVGRFTALRAAQYALNAGMGLFMAVVIVLNVRDGILCLRGRMDEMVLQLPAPLKRGAHAVIRRGARLRHFIVGAFLVGAAIAVLELACTGQVYAPTIMYMLKTGAARPRALIYLFWYNLCFIAPLLAVFVAAFQGLRSERLAELLRRHAAAVKFGTALLFTALLVLFLFVQRW